MQNEDTANLLRECNAGIKMGVASIEDVIDKAKDTKLREILSHSLIEHEGLGGKTHELLNKYGEEDKEPNPMAKGMSWLKSNVKLAVEHEDASVADVITDGCDMGIKSLCRYLNQYKNADEQAKDIARKLIRIEEELAKKLRDYL